MAAPGGVPKNLKVLPQPGLVAGALLGCDVAHGLHFQQRIQRFNGIGVQ